MNPASNPDTKVTINQISARLRAFRTAKSLSLGDVEELSGGAIKAVVLGSYERGARTLSVKRAIQISELYQIPLGYLLTGSTPIQVVGTRRIMIDLRKINRRAQDDSRIDIFRYRALAKFSQRLVHIRQDWNGEVLSIRQSDIEVISLLLDENIEQTKGWLESEKILLLDEQGN